jgi:urease accessory protein
MLPDWLPWLLQVNDSQFPSGAYAHSLGLEELVQHGTVSSPDELEAFLRHQIVPSLLAFEIPYLLRAHAAAAAENLETLQAMDRELDAWKLAAETRAASRQLGSRRLALVRKLAPSAQLDHYAESGAPCHHLIVTALELRGIPPEAAACAFAYQTMSGYTSASLKLLRIGQERVQLLLRGAVTHFLTEFSSRPAAADGRIGWFNPLLEIASMRHARAGERLFIS